MKIYVCRATRYYKKEKQNMFGTDYLDHDAYFLTLKDAISYGEVWANDELKIANKETVESVGYDIAFCYINNEKITEDDLFELIHNNYIKYSRFEYPKIVVREKYKVEGDK